MRFPHIPLFRIWYSTTYTILFIILLVLLAVTPGDHIYQSIRYRNIQGSFVVAGVYTLTALIVLSVYATRLYTNRSVLQAIPKSYIPVEPGEVGKNVRRMIVRNLERSALIAWDSRPRDIRSEIKEHGTTGAVGTRPSTMERRATILKKKTHTRPSTVIPISAESPPWGTISHPGWSSPASEDLTDLHYWTVIPELPNLIESKAVSLAPPDPDLGDFLQPADGTTAFAGNRVVAVLQRRPTMGLREYLGQLADLGLINPPEVGTRFLATYEYARFSTRQLTEKEFRNLMDVFADLLTGMSGLDVDVVNKVQAQSDTASFISSTASSAIHYRPTRPLAQVDTLSTYSGNTSTDSGGASPVTMRTAPSQMRAASSARPAISRTPSASTASLGSVRIHPVGPATHHESVSPTSSLRSAGSVIRLRPSPNPGELPYQFDFNS